VIAMSLWEARLWMGPVPSNGTKLKGLGRAADERTPRPIMYFQHFADKHGQATDKTKYCSRVHKAEQNECGGVPCKPRRNERRDHSAPRAMRARSRPCRNR